MLVSDGLPMWYVNTVGDKHLMRQLSFDVMTYLDNNGEEAADIICSQLNIAPIFQDEVEGIIQEWRGK
jgi:hypothetical protein